MRQMTIADDIKENSEKINHHGKTSRCHCKRDAAASAKQHGQKELTDINTLADEYLRLAYHGLRAKDKSFNATLKTDFDETIGRHQYHSAGYWKRVILNLYNNAFYAVAEKARKAPPPPKGGLRILKKNMNLLLQ